MKIEAAAADYLGRVRLRLLGEHERERRDHLLETRHDLKSSRIEGRHLRYVAGVVGQWVALLSFSGAAPHLKAREKWIGWSPRQQARRLGLVCNNSRFLLLVERERHRNPASKIPGLVLRRLARDWKERWCREVLVVETFVDESRHRGAAYRACGFEAVGAGAGFSRDSRDDYTGHGRPKQLDLRELRPGARKLPSRPRLPEGLREAEADIAGPCPFRAPEPGSLLERLRQLDDPRQGGHNLHHRLAGTLACAIAATLMGAGSYQACEDVCTKLTRRQRRALGCHYDRNNDRYDIPGDTNFFRVLNRVDPAHLEAIVAGWLFEQDPSQLDRLAVDGKVPRGTGRTDGRPPALLSLVTHKLRTTLRSVPIAENSNKPSHREAAETGCRQAGRSPTLREQGSQVRAAKPLLAGMNLQGCTVTADAMHCQQQTARFITRELGGDSIFGLKGNPGGILERAGIKLSQVLSLRKMNVPGKKATANSCAAASRAPASAPSQAACAAAGG